MIERPKKRMSRRKLGLIITLVDFLIIFIFIFYSNKYFVNSKTVKLDNGLVLKYKYFKLKNDIGYMFNFSVKNITDRKIKIVIENSGIIEFFIKQNNDIIWKKKSNFNDKFVKVIQKQKCCIVALLRKDDIIMYNEIYDNYKNSFLKGRYIFGAKIIIDGKEYVLEKSLEIEE